MIIGKGSRLVDCRFLFHGKNSVVEIGEECYIEGVTFWLEDGNKISIGACTSLCADSQLNAIEGASIYIGDDCIFAPEIHLRTGDSHSVLNSDGKRINPSSDITIDKHVWVGYRAIITKSVHIPEGCVVGAGAVVTRSVHEEHCAVAGVPAKIVKRNILWDRRRL